MQLSSCSDALNHWIHIQLQVTCNSKCVSWLLQTNQSGVFACYSTVCVCDVMFSGWLRCYISASCHWLEPDIAASVVLLSPFQTQCLVSLLTIITHDDARTGSTDVPLSSRDSLRGCRFSCSQSRSLHTWSNNITFIQKWPNIASFISNIVSDNMSQEKLSIKKWDIQYHISLCAPEPRERGGHGGCPPETLKRHEGTSSSLINVLFYKATHRTHTSPGTSECSMRICSFLNVDNLSLKVVQ